MATQNQNSKAARIADDTDSHAADSINHPSHYTYSAIEPIDVIEAWDLDWYLANIIKYIGRAGHKGPAIEDLKKARWYLERAIARRTEQKPKLPVPTYSCEFDTTRATDVDFPLACHAAAQDGESP